MEKRAMRAKDVMAYLSIGRTLLHNLTNNDQNFPKPTKISSRCVVWDKRELDDWLEWMAKRGRPIKQKWSKKEDLEGERFGLLTVISDSGERKSGRVVWICECQCGEKTKAVTGQLKNGHKKSCGCIRGSHLRADYECLNGVD